MMKWIVKDYFAAFGWKRIVEMNKKNQVFVNTFAFVLIVAFFEKINGIEISAYFFALYVPTLFMFISQQLHPLVLSKLFYLSPMDKKERMNQIIRMRYVRTAIPVAFAIVVNGVLILSGKCAWEYGIGCIFHVYVMVLTFNFAWINNRIKFFEKLGISDVFNVAVTAMAYYNVYMYFGTYSTFWKMVILIGAELIGTIIWHFQWEKAKKKMVDYELLTQ